MTATMYRDGYIDGADMQRVDVGDDDEEHGVGGPSGVFEKDAVDPTSDAMLQNLASTGKEGRKLVFALREMESRLGSGLGRPSPTHDKNTNAPKDSPLAQLVARRRILYQNLSDV
ncbi:hypothetical protein L1987_01466 [Smallanthus sonchifolius]|uniref:Uncharacterized protein n=1 Tax=Smallanthus sonchifolius TaxID=185202 RepID=A0ACB9K577_9ASTR|nr:hypothetical protein L1987_01466 [Smallanthus sonchifolius]